MMSEGTFPILSSILHPTDFSEGSLRAFHHALKAALLARCALRLLHVAPELEAALAAGRPYLLDVVIEGKP